VLREINRRPFVYDRQGRGQRLSLAGAQRKLPVAIDQNGAVHLPGDAPSTHILKPPSDEYDELVANEYLCLRAAALAGLAAPRVAFRPYRRRDGSEWYALQIERYDREHAEEGVRRIHQEDFCQALGFPSSLKYEEEGGPNLAACHRLIVEWARTPALSQRHFLQWTVFNLLVGNCDAHAKNLALLHTREGCRLSPVYDLVSTQIYRPRTDRLAMSVGGAHRVSEFDRDALLQLGRDLDINIRIARDRLGPFVDRAFEAIEQAADEARPYCRAPRIIDRIQALAGDRHRRLSSII
jgi:serine/threonine-protein kinase HipA